MYSILLLGLLAITSSFNFIPNATTNEANLKLQEANAYYQMGEKSKTVGEREQFFNNALKLYSDVEKDFNPAMGNGVLYYNIGNTYFQLGQYPWAVYYYYRAKALMPRSEEVQRNLSITLDKLKLEPVRPTIYQKIFAFNSFLSLPEKLEIFFFSGILALVLYSLYIWIPKKGIKFLFILSGLICLLALLSLGYSRYLQPVEGVFVHAVSLYRDAGEQYAKVTPKPFPSGLKVEVLNQRENGKWLKIITPDGTVGYVPAEAIRLI